VSVDLSFIEAAIQAMKPLLQFFTALSRAAKPNEPDSFRSNHNIGNAYLIERVPCFPVGSES
jgi:hypothetical protein